MVKCRVSFKGPGSSTVVPEDNIKGQLRVGSTVEVKHNNNYVEATIGKIMDVSQYTVVFDDGDVTTLKRTSLCLKSGKHYSESESLDHLPLTNPEHFGNPVRGGRGKRKRHTYNSSAAFSPGSNQTFASYPSSDVDDDDSAEGGTVTGSIDDDDSASNLTQQSLPKDKDEDTRSPGVKEESDCVGKVFVIEYGEKRGSKAKDTWYPALVVSPTTPENNTVKTLDSETEFLIKSFKDNKFYAILKKDVKDFDKNVNGSSLTDSNSSAALRAAVEKTISYLEKGELPNQWDSDLLLQPFKSDDLQETGITSELDSAAEDFEEYKDDQPSEEKDRFVAQLYKFMDERGTPINRVPTVNGKELDLYRLHRLVNKMGGYNKITSKDSWKSVYVRADLPSCSSENQENIAVNQLKAAYKKYLLNFTDFYRKLGYSTSFVNSPIASRSSSRPSRNERNWRTSASEAAKETPVKSKRRKSVTETETKPPVDEATSPTVSIPAPIPEETEIKVEPEDESSRQRRSSMKGKRDRMKSNAGLSSRKKGLRGDILEEDDESPEAQGMEPLESEATTLGGDEPWTPVCIGNDVEVAAGDKIRVKYFTKGNLIDIYEAKILKTDKSTDPEKQRFMVHYAGWNTRYDEWIKRNRIVEVIRDKNVKRRGGSKSSIKANQPPEDGFEQPTEPPVACDEPQLGPQTPVKRGGKPPALIASTARVSTESMSSASTAKSVPIKVSSKTTPPSKKTRGKTDVDEDTDSVSGKGNIHEDEEEVLKGKKESTIVETKVPPITISRRISTDSESRRGQVELTASSKNDGKEYASSDSEDESTADKYSNSNPRRRNRRDTKKSRHDSVSSKRRCDSPETAPSLPEAPFVKKSKHSKKVKEEAKPEEEAASVPLSTSTSSESITSKDDQKLSLSATDRKKKKADVIAVAPTQEPTTTLPVVNEEPESEDKYSKRKRRLSSSKDKDQSLASKVSSGETIKKKCRRDPDFDRKKDDEEVNQEVAKLFDDEKVPESSSRSEALSKECDDKEGAAPTFLLCSEEVPMSPGAAIASQTDSEGQGNKSKADEKNLEKEERMTKGKNGDEGNFSNPTTPESLKSGTLSSLTPPHERDTNEDASHNRSSQNNSSSNSDGEISTKEKNQSSSPSKHAPYHAASPQQHNSDDSCSRGPHETPIADTKEKKESCSSYSSPKRKRRGGRTRTASTSEANEETNSKAKSGHKNDKHGGYKTRGASAAKRGSHRSHHEPERYSPLGSDHLVSNPMSPISGISLSNFKPNAFFINFKPQSSYNYCTPIEDEDADARIEVLNRRIQELRSTYLQIRAELQSVERRRKKCRRKDKVSSGSPPASKETNNSHPRTSSTSSHHHHRQMDRSISNEQSSDTNDCFQRSVTQ
jgi:Ras-related protein Rab-1A